MTANSAAKSSRLSSLLLYHRLCSAKSRRLKAEGGGPAVAVTGFNKAHQEMCTPCQPCFFVAVWAFILQFLTAAASRLPSTA
jgi:hypothetical protein